MECLQGVPAASVITKNGKFWPCDNKYYKSCELFCPDQDRTLFETALLLWKTNGAPRLVCPVHQEAEKMRVVKNVAKQNFGKPFFVCSNIENPCSFWEWGDRVEIPRPTCQLGLVCRVRKVQKEGNNLGHLFYCCPNNLIKKRRVGFLNGNRSKAPTTTALQKI